MLRLILGLILFLQSVPQPKAVICPCKEIFTEEGCTYMRNSEAAYNPLTLIPFTSTLWYPNQRSLRYDDAFNRIEIPHDLRIQLVCPGQEIVDIGQASIEILCYNGSLHIRSPFLFPNKNKNPRLYELQCNDKPIHISRHLNETCGPDDRGQAIEVVFHYYHSFENGTYVYPFLRVYKICYDPEVQVPIYAEYTVTSHIYLKDRPSLSTPMIMTMQQDTFHSLKLRKPLSVLYSGHKKTINRLLGLPDDSTKYIQSKFYLRPYQLASISEFFYHMQQSATFYYVNTAPGWASIYNWNYAIEAGMSFASFSNKNLKVYTGTYGVSSLPHEQTGEQIDLYLSVHTENNQTRKFLPVPKVFWKVLYDPVDKAGIALVVVNNPFLTEIGDNLLCKTVIEESDFPHESNYVHWNQHVFSDGYSYACNVADLNATIKCIPYVDVRKLLVFVHDLETMDELYDF